MNLALCSVFLSGLIAAILWKAALGIHDVPGSIVILISVFFMALTIFNAGMAFGIYLGAA